MNNKSCGIYIHIPFCRSKCLYCDFYSLPNSKAELIEEYVSAVRRHFEILRLEKYGDTAVDTIFIGGGTPTVLSASQFEKIVNAAHSVFNIRKDAEFTVEANPLTFDGEKLLFLKSLGVNRISIGLQSANENELKLLGRAHTSEAAKEAAEAVRASGIDGLNLDIMYGIPEQTAESFGRTLEFVKNAAPDHVSVYGLQLEEGTPLFKRKEKYRFPDEDAERALNRLALEFLEGCGYRRYEISNYALAGHECRHNLRYWRQEEYIGIGAAAHSYFEGRRFRCPDSIKGYVDAVNSRNLDKLCLDSSSIYGEELEGEYIMLRMRLAEGVTVSEFEKDTGGDFEPYAKRLEPFVRSGHVEFDGSSYRFTADGADVSNYILASVI